MAETGVRGPVHSVWTSGQVTPSDRRILIKPLDGKLDRVEALDPSNAFGSDANHSEAFRWGGPVDTTYLPTRVQPSARYRDGPPDYSGVGGKAPIVSPRFKDVIEDLDPGVHQFVPVTLVLKSGEELPYFFWAICALQDTLAQELLDPPLRPWGKWDPLRKHLERGDRIRLAFDGNKLGPAHAWIEARYREQHFVSANFVERVQAEGIRGIRFEAKETV